MTDSAMEPLGMHHVSINVRNVAEGVAFYTQVLGLTQRVKIAPTSASEVPGSTSATNRCI